MGYGNNNAVVIGAGVMGAEIAAHLANKGLDVLLLDRLPASLAEEDVGQGLKPDMPAWRNKISIEGLDRLRGAKRPVFESEESFRRIRVGNTEDDLSKIDKYDWIIETIIEDLDIKRSLYARIELYRKKASIVTSNTSGIPIGQISAEFSEELKQHFLGTHFFNPPTYAPLIEMIPGKETPPELVGFMYRFLRDSLGKSPVITRDTPTFIANRLAIASSLHVFQLTREMGIRVEEADALCGKVMGRMRTAIFATADAVGLDTVQHVATNIHDNAQNDERIETFVLPQYVETMISNNWLGNKTGGGFFKRGKDAGGNVTQLALDLDALVYRDQVEPDYPCLHAAEQVVAQAAKVRAVVYGNDPGALFAWDILISDLAYAVNRVGEIADNIVDIDNTMKWGYAWRLGPFECWDAIGLRQSVERMEKEGRIVPARVTRMLDEGNESFYISVDGIERYFDFSSNSYLPKTT